jgi:hypothetical protein
MESRGTDGELAPAPKRGPGRPRKWASNAERARAYRQRKASEHYALDELRRDRRNLHRQVTRLTAALDRERRRRESAEHRVHRLAAELEALQERLGRLEASASAPRLQRPPAFEEGITTPRHQSVPPNRAARRRAAKTRRYR